MNPNILYNDAARPHLPGYQSPEFGEFFHSRRFGADRVCWEDMTLRTRCAESVAPGCLWRVAEWPIYRLLVAGFVV